MTESKQKKETKRKEKTSKPKAQKDVPKAAPRVEPRAEATEKIVYVGQKPVKNYVIACLTSFNAGSNPIVLKARGRAICKAVDTVELLRRAFLKDSRLQSIAISTEQVTREGNRKANVSTIEITVTRP
jgi:DNA-binding protein